ncbi:thioredoxin [Candidatus Microgenomates bacterium]|jgi:cytochrome c biogenesis protein CcdA/glutaredoxin|nr:MAG: thioredoxin [Candidatus Microgenomates bacterium]
MYKKIKILFLALFLFLSSFGKVRAAPVVNAYFFYGRGCPHCGKMQEFLNELEGRHPQLKVKEYEIYHNRENNALLQKTAENLNVEVGGVPFLVIGKDHFLGFIDGITTKEIENKIIECSQTACEDPVALIVKETEDKKVKPEVSSSNPNSVKGENISKDKFVKLPLFGEVDVYQLSLPVVTFVLAFLDGFNPCAMWTLLFLISLLLGMKDRKRMWILGITFIVTSAAVYFLFLSAWLNLFLFLGFVIWVRILIGLVALTAGGYYLRDYWTNKEASCPVTGSKKRQKIFQKIRAITERKEFFLALGGIIILAITVNLVELVCSAGLPAVYTQILSLSGLPKWQYYLYLLFYILIFMIDDLVVFFTAMITLKAVGLQSKYSRYSHLIGGFLMFFIGLLLLFKPEWLMFG